MLGRTNVLFETQEEAIAAEGMRSGNEIASEVGMVTGFVVIIGLIGSYLIHRYYFERAEVYVDTVSLTFFGQ